MRRMFSCLLPLSHLSLTLLFRNNSNHPPGAGLVRLLATPLQLELKKSNEIITDLNAPIPLPTYKLLVLCILSPVQPVYRVLGVTQETTWFVILKKRGISSVYLVYS